ncbi:U-box domain-containing protein 44 [Amborella trichopoda]|uniref:RING-type E3 ubiquitin transferase n=1 Tax=Amborella trichopoda TaxID=13333 RepID=U5D9W9_AMBTC|nr:U-box domain-containing protein 44 [Amborella trichopoda]XP_011627534.1 U-box domain-containing protein 44 [Amborella trichopoda]XP_020529967.1 U-box domain-containing protein 44 [Amborella trichopoda]ERN17178.1 hypothetical protein AMTR_s00044p00145170 [Amborella trichopoda]|eukprot:XP_006855711.1 U-box domain-containing protein 44 [Amborella trichopoda]
MAEVWEMNYDNGSQSDDSYHFERRHIEPPFDSFICPLTKQVFRDPVTIENGQTFEREAIEKWFRECIDTGRPPICPLTSKELKSTDLKPSIALRNTIEEWTARNEAVKLEIAASSLSPNSRENDALHALKYVQHICEKSKSNKHTIRNAGLIPNIVNLLKSGSKKVRCRALETLRSVAEEDADNKEAMATGDTIRTIVKFLSHELSEERELAVSLLYELSTSESLCEKIGSVNGAILILVGMTSSQSENILTVEKADKTLVNLETCEKNVRQMAENGRLHPLLTLLLEGDPDTKLSMATHLGEVVLSNDVKTFVAEMVGYALVEIMKSGTLQAREAALKALNQISSCEAGGKILVEAGILPPLIKDLFTVGINQLPMKLKEISATVLANVVSSASNFEPIPLGPDGQTLVSEDIIHNLLHLISNTGPAIESKLLQVLVGLTSSPTTVLEVVVAIRTSGATISLIQFIEASQRDLRLASIRLLHNLAPHMGQELADALRAAPGQLGGLVRVVTEARGGIAEEQASAAMLLANLPIRDSGLTRSLLEEGAFRAIILQIKELRRGETRGSRFVTSYLTGLVGILTRLTFVIGQDQEALDLAQEHDLVGLFSEHLQANGLDEVQRLSAMALENLSAETRKLTNIPEVPRPGPCGVLFSCFYKQPEVMGTCPVHLGICSRRETFCLLEGNSVKKLAACLDHGNEAVVEAALAALSTLLDDGVDIDQGVQALCEAEAVGPMLEILKEGKTEVLRRRVVWALERVLRSGEVAAEVSGDAAVASALVDAFRHGDYRTRQVAEQALRHVNRMPNFSGIFQKMG